MVSKWTEATTLNCEISTMWEMKPRVTPQQTSRSLMGMEQVTRHKTPGATWWW
jgi:hypothetical protein